MEGDIQYIADSYLIERTFQILAEYEEEGGPLKKHAFDLSSMLGGIASTIKSWVGSQIHGQDSGGITRTVVDFLAPAVFFRLHPLLGLLVTVAQLFGYDLYSIYQKIIGVIMPKIQSGQPISTQDINEAGKAAIPPAPQGGDAAGGAGDTGFATASDDLLAPLRALHSEGTLKKNLTKNAVGWGSSSSGFAGQWGAQSFMPQNSNPLFRMFSFLAPASRGNMLTGILVWFLKTILLSAGLLAVGGAVAGALGYNPGGGAASGGGAGATPSAGGTPSAGAAPSAAGAGMRPAPTGAGSWNFRPKANDIWVENLNGKQPYEQVLEWTIASYPDLDEYDDIIMKTPSFWNVVRGISQDWRPGQQQLVIPPPYRTRDELINMFINDVYRQIQQLAQRGEI